MYPRGVVAVFSTSVHTQQLPGPFLQSVVHALELLQVCVLTCSTKQPGNSKIGIK